MTCFPSLGLSFPLPLVFPSLPLLRRQICLQISVVIFSQLCPSRSFCGRVVVDVAAFVVESWRSLHLLLLLTSNTLLFLFFLSYGLLSPAFIHLLNYSSLHFVSF